MDWQAPEKPFNHTYSHLINAILKGEFPANTHLPGERHLAELLGVTRPTLREALQRLAADGWVEIRQGKPSRVKDIWVEGSLNTLSSLVNSNQDLPINFVENLLQIRNQLAPAYTDLAVRAHPEETYSILSKFLSTNSDSPEAFVVFDWDLQH